MAKLRSASVPAPVGSASDLTRLIETEQRLAARLEAAHAECEALLTTARDAAARAEAELVGEIASEVARVAADLERDTAARIAELRRDGETRAQRYASATDSATADGLAKGLLRWLLSADGSAR